MSELNEVIDVGQSEVLNGNGEVLGDLLSGKKTILSSEVDAELIIKLTFKGVSKIKSIKFTSPDDGKSSIAGIFNLTNYLIRFWS